jgi:LPS-assembly lipoprotein
MIGPDFARKRARFLGEKGDFSPQSLPDRRKCLILALAAVTAGCGFQPIYAPARANDPNSPQNQLASIDVELTPERPGQELRQAMQERLGSDSGAAPIRYRLHLNYTIAGEAIGILPSAAATRVRLLGNVIWTLKSADPPQTVVTTGSARALDAFNIIDQQYFASDLENEQIQRRLAGALADQITTQLAVFFRNQENAKARSVQTEPPKNPESRSENINNARPPA